MALQMLSAKEVTRVVMRMQVKCTISKPGIFAEYAERYLGVKDAITKPSTEFALNDIHLYEQGKEPVEIKKEKIDTAIRFNMNCLGEEALQATSMPKMAERVAKQIYQLREARTALITGDMAVLPDGEALKTMLKRIDREERELVALFIGKRTSYTYYEDVVVTPDEDVTYKVLARFSKSKGVVDVDDMIGEPIYMTLTGKRVKAPELTPKQLKKVYEWEYVKGNAWIKVTFNEKIEKELYIDEVKQFGADIPVL